MKKSTLIKLIVVVTITIGIVIVNGNSFGIKNLVSKSKCENVAKIDSVQYPNLLEEVTVIGKVPVK